MLLSNEQPKNEIKTKKQFLLTIFISALIFSSFVLYKETELYIDTYHALFSIKSAVLEVSLLLQEDTSETKLPQAYIKLKLAVCNPSKMDVKILSLDFTHGILLNDAKLIYYKPKIFSYLNIIIPKRGEQVFSLRFSVTSSSDIKHFLDANTTKEWNWHFIIYSMVKVAFKKDKIDLSSSFKGISNFDQIS